MGDTGKASSRTCLGDAPAGSYGDMAFSIQGAHVFRDPVIPGFLFFNFQCSTHRP